jgi:uncharacterized membrane protein
MPPKKNPTARKKTHAITTIPTTTTATVTTAPTPAPAVVVVEAAPAATADTTEVPPVDPNVAALEALMASFTEIVENMTKIRSDVTALSSSLRTLQKKTEREIKTAHKNASKKKRKATNRAPSGFVKPTLISDQLADFLGMDRGSELARTDVTREINQYIRTHGLQDPENGRKINPDPKLKRLLALKPSDELTYFNLQRYMSPHFAKANKAVPGTIQAPVALGV